MKQITRNVIIEGQEHYLIQVDEKDFKEGKVMKDYVGCYGTIPYEWVDDNGRLNRSITLLDVLMGKTIDQAIENRKDIIITSKLTEEERTKYWIKKYSMVRA